MKIGFVYGQPVSRATSGGSVHGHQLSRQLHRRGHELSSFFFGEDSDSVIAHYRARKLFLFLRNISCLYLRVEWQGGPERLSPIKLLSIKRPPVIWELNGTPSELLHTGTSPAKIEKINQRLRNLGKFSDAVCTVSDDVSEYARKTLGLRNVTTIPNGSDPDLFHPRNLRDGLRSNSPLRVAWIGTTKAAWQDFDTMFSAAAELCTRRANIEFHIFGDPTNLPQIKPDNIKVRGIIPYQSMGNELSELDVGLHIFRSNNDSQVEGSPLKIFDYMACGLAIVTQPHGQRREILEKWKSGMPTSGRPEDLSRVLLELENNRPLCKALGRNGRQSVELFFNWERAAIQTEQVLFSAIHNSKPSTPSTPSSEQ